MENALKELVKISNRFGKDPEYVIAGGGNTSFKNQDFLWIKASGTSLATITEEGFAKMDRKALAGIAGKTYSNDPLQRESEIIKELFSCVADNSGLRPSVETSLHNLLNFSFVVHTHPTLVNGLMCALNSREETYSIFGEEVLLVGYTDPGYILFKLVEKRITEYVKKNGKEPQVIFLENHGVFVSAETPLEIEEIYNELSKLIKDKLSKPLPSSIDKNNGMESLVELLSREKNLFVKAFNSELIHEFIKNREAFKQADTAFSPDNIVYCKAHYLWSVSDPSILITDYSNFEKKYGYSPRVIAIENQGIICLEESEQSVNTVYEVFRDMLKISFFSRNFGGPRFMTPQQIDFIDSWEVENYRRKVAKDG